MRKACFAFVLVIAAFTGGAVMNGPGLEWLKSAIRTRIVGTDTGVRKPAEPSPVASATPREVPASPLPPLTLDGLVRPANSSDPSPAGKLGSERASSAIAVTSPAPKSEAAPVELALPESIQSRVKDLEVSPASEARTVAAMITNSRDWNDLRRKMREMGISRYEVEGEPGGKSRFRCLIPLAGRRAVGQQFEGEGDDDFQAAEAALRRVALWKATEMAPQ